MMQRKTDRFQRIVAQAGKRIDGISPALADPMFTVKLLRRQHRAYVRMVNEQYKHSRSKASPIYESGFFDAVEIIARLMKEYKR